MKTAFKVKLIFETPHKGDLGEDNEFTIQYMINAINKGNVSIEMIGSTWTNDYEPVIIITEKGSE